MYLKYLFVPRNVATTTERRQNNRKKTTCRYNTYNNEETVILLRIYSYTLAISISHLSLLPSLQCRDLIMMYTGALAAAALLLASPATAAGLYPKSSAVLQVDAKNYDRLIAKSNYTSVSFVSITAMLYFTDYFYSSDRRILRSMVRPLQESPASLRKRREEAGRPRQGRSCQLR